MVKLHTTKGIFDLKLRGRFNGIRSEAKFREVIENSISAYERMEKPVWKAIGAALRSKWENGDELDVLRIFGVLNTSKRN